jgi:hypothetical protein
MVENPQPSGDLGYFIILSPYLLLGQVCHYQRFPGA